MCSCRHLVERYKHIVHWAGLVYVDHLAVHHSSIHYNFGSSQKSWIFRKIILIGRNPFEWSPRVNLLWVLLTCNCNFVGSFSPRPPIPIRRGIGPLHTVIGKGRGDLVRGMRCEQRTVGERPLETRALKNRDTKASGWTPWPSATCE